MKKYQYEMVNHISVHFTDTFEEQDSKIKEC